MQSNTNKNAPKNGPMLGEGELTKTKTDSRAEFFKSYDDESNPSALQSH